MATSAAGLGTGSMVKMARRPIITLTGYAASSSAIRPFQGHFDETLYENFDRFHAGRHVGSGWRAGGSGILSLRHQPGQHR